MFLCLFCNIEVIIFLPKAINVVIIGQNYCDLGHKDYDFKHLVRNNFFLN